VYDALGGKAGQFLHQPPTSATRLDSEPPLRLPTDDWMRSLVHLAMTPPSSALQAHVERIEGTGTAFEVHTTAHASVRARAIIVATGVDWHQPAVTGIERFVTHGLGYSIKPYAHLVKDRTVAVMGTSSRTLRGVAELVRRATHIFWIVEDSSVLDTPIGHALGEQRNVTILTGYSLHEVVGFSHIEEIVVKQAEYVRRLSIDYLFIDRGVTPHSGPVCDLVELDVHGFIVVNHHHATSTLGIFATGDVTTRSCEHAVAAIGDGTRAAMSAYDYLLAMWLSTRATAPS
jgi:NADH-dependent peroxiredoxin subunit F